MTTNRTPLYYQIRTLVRFVFWGGFSIGVGLGLGKVANIINGDDNPCQIQLNRDFTWFPTTGFTNLNECDHPTNVILKSDNTWEWEN